MSTDQQQKPTESAPAPAHTPAAGPNPVTERLSTVWQSFAQGKLISYRWMAITLLVCTGIGLWIYLSTTGRTADSAKWTALEKANTPSAMEDIIKNFPNTAVARIARLELARVKLGPNGIDALSQPESKQKAITNIEASKKDFEELAGLFKNDPVFLAECYLSLAKAESALLGLEREGAKANVDTLIDYLEKLSAIDENAPWCQDARKLADALKNKTGSAREELIRVQQELYAPLPPVPASSTSPLGGGIAPPPVGVIPGR